MTVDLSRLQSLAEAATPGPWHANTTTHIVCDDQPEPVARIVIYDRDVEYIAAADPVTVLALVRIAQAAAFVAVAPDEAGREAIADLRASLSVLTDEGAT